MRGRLFTELCQAIPAKGYRATAIAARNSRDFLPLAIVLPA
ncbi:hypothetical protein [Pantanalinema rosaneae]